MDSVVVFGQSASLAHACLQSFTKVLDMLESRDLTTRHHIARVDIARLGSVVESMLTTSLYLLQEVLYELLIELKFLVLFISVLVIPTCGRLS